MLVKRYNYVFLVVTFFLVLEVSDSSTCKCGRPSISRIVGGEKVDDPSKYPWLVVLQVHQDSKWMYQCVGALIHPQWVLTAAHCVYKKSGAFKKYCEAENFIRERCIRPAEEIGIALGSTQGKERELEVSKVILNENYRPISTEHDIALLQLQSPVECNERSSPICLSKGRKMEYPGTPVIAAGWGQTGPDDATSDHLKQALMIVSKCEQGGNSETLCATADSSNGTPGTACKGDSGAPLMHIDKNVYYTVGIVSTGSGHCGIDDKVSFVRVSKYRNWINQHVDLREVTK